MARHKALKLVINTANSFVLKRSNRFQGILGAVNAAVKVLHYISKAHSILAIKTLVNSFAGSDYPLPPVVLLGNGKVDPGPYHSFVDNLLVMHGQITPPFDVEGSHTDGEIPPVLPDINPHNPVGVLPGAKHSFSAGSSPSPPLQGDGNHASDFSDHLSSGDKSFVQKAKLFLPAERERIRSLRSSISSPPVSDPKDMGELIHDFWGQSIWASKEHDTGFSKKFLRDYRKEIDLSLIHRPTLGRITHAILESKDSSAGPDGIPFIVYRNLIDIAAPVLLEVALHIADGNAPPKGFNLGLLHLLPKKHTGLVQDTRPITVNNTDNRILAVVLVDCIEPAVQALIGQEQLLFLKKRHMTDHVRDVNRFYYSSLSKKTSDVYSVPGY